MVESNIRSKNRTKPEITNPTPTAQISRAEALSFDVIRIAERANQAPSIKLSRDFGEYAAPVIDRYVYKLCSVLQDQKRRSDG